jgi:thiopurine S-methyltransferase
MDRAFWLDRWKNNDIGWHKEEVNPHLVDLWPYLTVPAGGRVFVPLCGKTLDLYWLAQVRGHPVVGVELSDKACQEFYAEHLLEPEVEEVGGFRRYYAAGVEILCGDFFDLHRDVLGEVHAVFDRASLAALPPDMRSRYAAHLEALCPERPPILFWTLDYPQHEMEGPPFAVAEGEVAELFGNDYQHELLRDWDVLDESPRFQELGLTRLHERVYRLTRGD